TKNHLPRHRLTPRGSWRPRMLESGPMQPLCDQCVRQAILVPTMEATLRPEQQPRANGPAYLCQVHPDRSFHAFVGYYSDGNKQHLAVGCHECDLYCYIVSARSAEDATFQCPGCGRQEQLSLDAGNSPL